MANTIATATGVTSAILTSDDDDTVVREKAFGW